MRTRRVPLFLKAVLAVQQALVLFAKMWVASLSWHRVVT